MDYWGFVDSNTTTPKEPIWIIKLPFSDVKNTRGTDSKSDGGYSKLDSN